MGTWYSSEDLSNFKCSYLLMRAPSQLWKSVGIKYFSCFRISFRIFQIGEIDFPGGRGTFPVHNFFETFSILVCDLKKLLTTFDCVFGISETNLLTNLNKIEDGK